MHAPKSAGPRRQGAFCWSWADGVDKIVFVELPGPGAGRASERGCRGRCPYVESRMLMIIFDAHLDLAWNALDWNRDLRLPVAEIRRREQGQSEKGRGCNT